MTKEEVKFQVAVSCIQGVLEAKHGIIGEVVPVLAVAESLRIADEFVRQWFKDDDESKIKEEIARYLPYCDDISNDTKKRWINYLKGNAKENDKR